MGRIAWFDALSRRRYGTNIFNYIVPSYETTQHHVDDTYQYVSVLRMCFDKKGQADAFDSLLMSPLRDQLLSTTWMHERLNCDGTQRLNRTAMYGLKK
jgi:hypothetical protein